MLVFQFVWNNITVVWDMTRSTLVEIYRCLRRNGFSPNFLNVFQRIFDKFN